MRLYVLFFLLFSGSLFAKSEEPSVWLTWRDDPTTTMTVMWLTNKSESSNAIAFQKKGESKWHHTEGKSWELPNKKPYLIHRVDLKRLKPDSIYRFKVGKKSTSLSLRTMPAKLSNPIRFITGGDAYHKNFKRFQTMTRRAAKESPRFAIIGGDISYASATKNKPEKWDKWLEFFSCWSKEMKDRDGCLIPLLVTIGNHEVSGSFNRSMKEAPFYYLFFEKATYDLSFGSYLHLTFLDSGHTQKIKGKQTKWLEKVLKKNKKHTHRFAIYHVGAYPSSNDFDFHASKAVRKHWVPLFEKYKINACFESHDHAYKRTHPLLNGKKNPDGVVYFGDGSWGVAPRKPESRPYLAQTAQKQQVLLVEIGKSGRKFWAIDAKGKKIDHYEQK